MSALERLRKLRRRKVGDIPLEKQYEYVSPSKPHSHRAYVMRRPITRDQPSKAQKQVRAQFGKAAYDSRNKFGTVFLEDIQKEVPKTAEAVRKRLKGRKFAPVKPLQIFPPEVIKMILLKEAMARLAGK